MAQAILTTSIRKWDMFYSFSNGRKILPTNRTFSNWIKCNKKLSSINSSGNPKRVKRICFKSFFNVLLSSLIIFQQPIGFALIFHLLFWLTFVRVCCQLILEANLNFFWRQGWKSCLEFLGVNKRSVFF